MTLAAIYLPIWAIPAVALTLMAGWSVWDEARARRRRRRRRELRRVWERSS